MCWLVNSLWFVGELDVVYIWWRSHDIEEKSDRFGVVKN